MARGMYFVMLNDTPIRGPYSRASVARRICNQLGGELKGYTVKYLF